MILSQKFKQKRFSSPVNTPKLRTRRRLVSVKALNNEENQELKPFFAGLVEVYPQGVKLWKWLDLLEGGSLLKAIRRGVRSSVLITLVSANTK